MDQAPDEFTMPAECASEMKTSKEKTHNLLITTQAPTIASVIKCEDFSTLTRLLRVTAYVLRAFYLDSRALVIFVPTMTDRQTDYFTPPLAHAHGVMGIIIR